MKTKTLGLSAAVLLLAGWATPAQQQQDDLVAERTRGSATAPVTIYEMSDFQCPWCGRYAREVEPQLDREYVATGKVKVVFINFPLSQIHPNAEPAAEFAMCAAKQHKFWPVHDLLYRTQNAWGAMREPGSFFLGLADSVHLDREQLLPCVRNHETRALVESDARASVRSGATSTPSFYIEGGMMAGLQPIETWRTVLDSIIRVKTAAR